jgi:hypothetical protein
LERDIRLRSGESTGRGQGSEDVEVSVEVVTMPAVLRRAGYILGLLLVIGFLLSTR